MDRVRRFLMSGLLFLMLGSMMSCANTTPTPTNTSGIAATLSTLTLSPPSLNGGQTSTATVTLTEPAPAGGAQIILSTSNDTVTLPTTLMITIPENALTGTFKILTLPVGSNQTAQISVTYLTFTTLQATLTILTQNPLSVTGFTVSPTSVTSGQTLLGTVTLNEPALSPGQQVFVTTSDISVVQPQNPITVQTHQTTATFSIFTSPITTSRNVTVSATLNSTSIPVQLTLQPTGTAVTSMNIVPFTAAGGQSMSGTITVSPPAPAGGEAVQLTAVFTNPATPTTVPLPITFPATVNVPAGSTQGQFTVMTSAVTKTTDVTLTAALNTTQYLFTVEVVPSLTLAGLNCLQPSVTVGNSISCSASLSIPAPAGGQTVNLTSSSTTALPVPATVMVPAGTSSKTFNVVGGAVTTPTPVTITATLPGTTTTSTTTPTIAVVIVVPVSALIPTGFSLSAMTVQGGAGAAGNVTATVTIAAPAPPGGLPVTLTASDPSVQFPNGPTVTVPQNQTTVSFPITTTAVTALVKVMLTAASNGSFQPATLIVVPPAAVASLTINPTSVTGSNSAVGTVTLQNQAPQNGVVVTIGSNTNFAQAAPSVTVVQGATTAIFAITTLAVPSPETATITASIGTSSQQATLSIVPPVADLRLIYFNPSTVFSGGTSTGTVVLTGPAPAPGGTTVVLGSSVATVTLPTMIVVPAGQSTATFSVRAMTGVTSATQVQISGSVKTVASNNLNIIPVVTATVSEQIVAGGETNSTDFPLTAAFQTSIGAPGNDTGFLTSITQTTAVGSATASAAAFSTYLGGMSSFGQVRDMAVDSTGNVFACGVTLDQTLATTKNAAQLTPGGGKDAFVAEFNKAGVLQYLTYIGGSGDETCNSMTIDQFDNVYMLGSTTNSSGMGATPLMGTSGSFQAANAGGSDFFIAKIITTATASSSPTARLPWLTLLGGTGDDFGNGRIAISLAGALVVTGTTQPTNTTPPAMLFPIPPGIGVPTLTGVGTAGVVVNITADGTTLLSTTLLFGKINGANPGTPTVTTASGGMAFDTDGNIYVCGQTNASDLLPTLVPKSTTTAAFQPALKGPQNAYVAVLGATGTISFVTYLGGTSSSTVQVQACKGIIVDSDMNPTIVMPTDASDYPVTVTLGPAAPGLAHFAVTKLTSDLSTVIFSTLIGGSGTESADATRLQLDSAENLYFSLSTTSGDFPVTPNALHGTFTGTPLGTNRNVVVVKLASSGASGTLPIYSTFLGGSADNSTTSVIYHLNLN